MLLIHVPNHFKLNIFHIKDLKFFNTFLYLLFGFICFNFDTEFIINNEYILNFIKSIIISHILYQEFYVLNNIN